ncbi:hypothetical protein MKEN_00218600 [Mycena kentingensis (nom. inval.)]|nr:hypothetical protein MKEN_00218600 [Mycena kentingensis (nom. inval.)]
MAKITALEEAVPRRGPRVGRVLRSLFRSSGQKATVHDSIFNQYNGNVTQNFNYYAPTSEGFDGELQLPTVDLFDIEFVDELTVALKSKTHVHSARTPRGDVIVRIFEGDDAKVERKKHVELLAGISHSKHLSLVACSGERSQKTYLVYRGCADSGASDWMKQFLRDDIQTALLMACKLIHDVTNAVLYLTRFHGIIEDLCPGNFELLVDADGRISVCLVPASPRKHFWYGRQSGQSSVRREVLLADKVARRALFIASDRLYGDRIGLYASIFGRFVSCALEDKEIPTITTPRNQLSLTARRTIIWKMGNQHSTLELNSEQLSTLITTLKHRKDISFISYRHERPTDNLQVHRCSGYSREMILLGPTLKETVVVSESGPSQHEKCLVCGRRVHTRQNMPVAREDTLHRPMVAENYDNYYTSLPPDREELDEFPYGRGLSGSQEETRWTAECMLREVVKGKVSFAELRAYLRQNSLKLDPSTQEILVRPEEELKYLM